MKGFDRVSDYLQAIDQRMVPFWDCLVMKNHELIFHSRRGTACRETGQAVSDDSLYWIYSMTKVITCTAVMQLVERKLLGLDDPIRNYLPAYGHLKVQQGGKLLPCCRELTPRLLMSMQGGLDYDLESKQIQEANRKAGGDASTREIVDALAEKPLDFEPGSHFQYSLCHDVLGALIEAVSGCSFGEYLRKNILDPLHMQDTGFIPTPDQAGRISSQYLFNQREGISHPIARTNPYRLSGRYESGGAGLFSKPGDYIRLADALCCGGESADGVRILKPGTIDLMRTPQLKGQSLQDFRSTVPGGYNYALGVRTMEDSVPGVRSPVGEFGWDGAAGSYVLIDPANRLTIVYFQHVRDCYPASQLHRELRDLIYEGLEDIG